MGTLNVRARPTWGILGTFEHKCRPRDREVWTILKTRGSRDWKVEKCFNDESKQGLECGELGQEWSAILKVPTILRCSNTLSRGSEMEERKVR